MRHQYPYYPLGYYLQSLKMETLSRIAMLVDVASALYPRTSNTLKAIGLLVVLRQIVNLLLSFYRAFLRRRRNLPQRYGRNSWALITGSSEGIGKGIALNLAKQGFNIILSARSEFKLDVARCDIRRSCPQVDIKTFVMDYSRASEPEYLQQRLNELYGLDVAIVVNNVGVDVLDHYHELTEKQVLNLIDLNCTATAQMNRLFIPRMLERYNKRGHKSAIVNVASLAGEIPMPMHNVYSASKAFVDCLSRALSYEYAGKIDVIALNPSEVCTAMTFHKKDIFTVSPEQCAEGLMNDLGHDRRTNGHIAHKLQAALYHFVPQGLFNHLWMSYVAPQFMAERRRAQKK